MKRSLTLLALAALLTLNSCGGGGSSSLPFAGVWEGRMLLVDQVCDYTFETSFDAAYTVNEDSSAVALETSGGDAYEGLSEASSSFTVYRSSPSKCGETGEATQESIEYLKLTEDTVKARYIYDRESCETGDDWIFLCYLVYEAELTRVQK